MKKVLTEVGNIPEELLVQKRFFKLESKDDPPGGWNKPANQIFATDIKGLVAFDTCGHGIADDYLFFDFDHVLDKNGEFVNPDAEKWFNYIQLSFDGYAERSISGTGIHIFAKPSPNKFGKIVNKEGEGILFFDKKKNIKLEIFYKSAARYCAMTGNLFRTDRCTIASGEIADDVLTNILNAIAPATPQPQKTTKQHSVVNSELQSLVDEINNISVDELTKKGYLQRSENGAPAPTGFICPWCGSGTHKHKTGALTFYDIPNPHFACHACSSGGDVLKFLSKIYGIDNSGKDFFVLVRQIADDFAIPYDAKIFDYNPKKADNTPADLPIENDEMEIPADSYDPIKKWQMENGEIDPKLLTRLKQESERIQNTTDFAFAARDTTTQKFLGAFQYYSCFSHICDKFFSDLKRKKDDVANKVREYNSLKRNEKLYIKLKGDAAREEIAAVTPTDSELALTNINITETKNKVSTFTTAAKKAHKQYLRQKEIDALNAKYQAERDAYELDPPSTQKSIPDCPIDLVLPLGIYFDAQKGIRIVDFDKPVGNNGRPVIEACQNIIVPIRAFREVTKRGENPKTKDQYEIAIKTAKHWRRVIVDARTLQDARAIPALTDFGAHISEPRMLAKYFAKIIALNELNGRLSVTKLYMQPGWQDKEFKFFAYPTGGDDYIVKNSDFDYKNVFTPQGDSDAWKNMLHRVLFHSPKTYSATEKVVTNFDGTQSRYSKENNPANFSSKPNVVAAMILGSTFGAPLIAPLRIRNTQMVLGFDSGNGKTAAAKFATSFFGDPAELCPTCNATENFLEDLAVKLNDFPHAVDELQAAKKHIRENMDELVYKFSGGTTRGRADIQGNARPTFHYRGFRIFTGEQPIINNSSGQGAISRIFEIRKAELFADPFAIEIHSFIQDNFGFFGKHYTTEFIPNNLDRIRKRFALFRDVFSQNSYQLLSSHATFLAYALTGLQFGLEAVGYSEEDAIRITFGVLENIQEFIDDAPNKSMAKNVNRAIADIHDYIDTHREQFIKEVSNSSGAEEFISANRNTETLGVQMLDGRVAIFPLQLRKIINELGYPSANAIIRALGENAYLDCGNSKKKDFKKRLPEHFAHWFGKSVWFYILKPAETIENLAAA